MRQTSKSSGFTLIELLVVIAIIGLLASIVMTAMNNARLKARDARRLSDVKEVKTGLDLFFSHGNGYPLKAAFDAAYASGNPLTCGAETIMKVPQDPLYPTAGFSYSYDIPVGATQASGCGGVNNLSLQYTLSFVLERTPGVTYTMNEDGQFNPALPQM